MDMTAAILEPEPVAPSVLDFLWLELTNQCNLKCVHCYSESGPASTERNILDADHYMRLLSEAYDLGCRRVQFIGGEPTLNRALARLIQHADESGFELIEVYTNLVKLSPSLLDTFIRHRVAIATSVYADAPDVHDAITMTRGSHKKTLANIARVKAAGLQIRVGVIGMEQNADRIDDTYRMLQELGISNIGFDRVRDIGRARGERECSMGSLCGNCANNILAIGPDGVVAPCIMSKQWSVGSVLTTSFKDIAVSNELVQTRRLIASATAQDGGPNPCEPDRSCMPNCSPSYNCLPCSPNAGQPCEPNRWCDPSKR